MENITINKLSKYEGEIIETIPQKVIPPSEVKRTVTIKGLRAEIEAINISLSNARASKQNTLDQKAMQMAVNDSAIAQDVARIDKLQVEKDKILNKIKALKESGVEEEVKEELEPADMLKNTTLQEEVISN